MPAPTRNVQFELKAGTDVDTWDACLQDFIDGDISDDDLEYLLDHISSFEVLPS